MGQHVQLHGLTPGVLERLEVSSRAEAFGKARETIRSSLSPEKKLRYDAVQFVEPIGFLLIFGYGVYCFLNKTFWLVDFGTSIALWLVVTRILKKEFVEPVDTAISNQAGVDYPEILDREKKQRIEYERFYTSIEWRVLRAQFLSAQKRKNGCFTCYICKEPVLNADLSVDHHKPRSRFPEMALNMQNLRVVHSWCNSRKGSKDWAADE